MRRCSRAPVPLCRGGCSPTHPDCNSHASPMHLRCISHAPPMHLPRISRCSSSCGGGGITRLWRRRKAQATPWRRTTCVTASQRARSGPSHRCLWTATAPRQTRVTSLMAWGASTPRNPGGGRPGGPLRPQVCLRPQASGVPQASGLRCASGLGPQVCLRPQAADVPQASGFRRASGLRLQVCLRWRRAAPTPRDCKLKCLDFQTNRRRRPLRLPARAAARLLPPTTHAARPAARPQRCRCQRRGVADGGVAPGARTQRGRAALAPPHPPAVAHLTARRAAARPLRALSLCVSLARLPACAPARVRAHAAPRSPTPAHATPPATGGGVL